MAIDVTESAESAADLLRNYGENLPHMQRRCWGAFVALLGDDLPIRQLADELTGDTHGFRKGLVVDSQRGTAIESAFPLHSDQWNLD